MPLVVESEATCWLAGRWWGRDGQYCTERGCCWRSLDAVPHVACWGAQDVADMDLPPAEGGSASAAWRRAVALSDVHASAGSAP